MGRTARCANHVLEVVGTRLGISGRVYVNPGAAVPWDPGSCDQLVVRVISRMPRMPADARQRTGPNPMATVPAWVVKLGVQLTRCIPVIDDRGRVPTATELHLTGMEILDEADKILTALLCDVDSDYRCRPIRWVSLGPEGGIAGGEWETDLEIQS